MAFGICVHNAERVRNYEACAALFEKPGFIGAGWNSEMRALDGRRKIHLRVERGENYFDVVLYSTAMARYYKPEIIDGHEHREVHYNVDGRQSSTSFQWHVLGFSANGHTRLTTADTTVLIGLNPDVDGPFPVRLHLVDGRVWLDRSRDAPAQIGSTTSPERKAERKEFKKWLRPYEAMSKIMDGPFRYRLWEVVAETKAAYITKELFDPTELCMYIRSNGVAKVVDMLFPLGDVKNYNPSFMEIV